MSRSERLRDSGALMQSLSLRIGLIYEPQESYPFGPSEPADANAELADKVYLGELIGVVQEFGHYVRPILSRDFLTEFRSIAPQLDFAINLSKG